MLTVDTDNRYRLTEHANRRVLWTRTRLRASAPRTDSDGRGAAQRLTGGAEVPDPIRQRGTRSTTAATVAVGLMAAALSYDHMRLLAVHVGEPGWRAAVLPLTVDGLVVVATKVTVARRGAGRPVGWLPYSALALSVLASLAANVVSGDPTLVPDHVVRWVVSAWPPLAVAMAFELVLQYRSEAAATAVLEDQSGLAPVSVAEPEAVPVGRGLMVTGDQPVEAQAALDGEDQARAVARPHLVRPTPEAAGAIDVVLERHRRNGTAPSRRVFIDEVKAAGGSIGTNRAAQVLAELRSEVAS